jgi:hypothetical protein
MPITLPLEEMTVPEKLQIMEARWADLCRDSDALESPTWHGEVLAEREQRIATGETGFTDWEKAKADIRARVR